MLLPLTKEGRLQPSESGINTMNDKYLLHYYDEYLVLNEHNTLL